MNSSETLCISSTDTSFGPFVGPECRDGFDFTLVFEQSILVLLPAALLLVLAPVRLFRLRNVPVKVAGRRLRTVKLALIALLAALHLVLVVLWAIRPSNTRLDRVSVAAACVSFASSLMSCVLSCVEHAKSPRPSSLLNVYLAVSLLLDVALLRTLWLVPMSTAIPAVFTAAFALKAILVVLEGWSKAPYLIAGSGTHSPEVTAGLYARAVFAWVTPLLMTGFRKLLRPMDLFELDEDMGSAGLIGRFWRHWHNQKVPASKQRLIVCCITTLRWSFIAVVIPRLALLAFTICQPLILNRLLVFLDDASQSIQIGYGLIAAYGLVYSGIALSQALYWHRNARSVTLLRGVLVSAVFSKATELSITATDDSAAVTLMSSDVDVIVRAVREVHEFWANIIQLAIATWLLSTHIGYAASGPIIVSLVALIATVIVSPLARKYQIAWLGKTQKRVGITSAMIGHIKSIKCSGLTQNLSDTIVGLRADEIRASRPFRIVSSVTSAIAQVPLLMSPVAAFALFQGMATNSSETLNATRLFSALSLIVLMAQPLFFMFEAILDMSAALGAFERIQTFLTQESRLDPCEMHSDSDKRVYPQRRTESIELQSLRDNVSSPSASHDMNGLAIEVVNASISWLENHTLLRGLNFTVDRSQLVLLLGPVASGKTTLLKALLGEVRQNQTIRDNVIGHSNFDRVLYREVVKACDLEKDFDQLAQGDSTVICSKGLALSGGQKQRVALARAVYSKPQIALFDDVFSGLDSQTAQTVFENLFSKRAAFLSSADLIISLNKEGRISEQGTFHDLENARGYAHSLLKNKPQDSSIETPELTPEHGNIEQVPKSTQGIPKQLDGENDTRRQRGDSTVYRYYFSSTGAGFMIVLLVLEVIWAFLESFPSFFGTIAKAGLLAASTPYIAATFPLLAAVYFYLQRGYLRTSRQLRLLDLEEKAPLYTQFLETLSGLATIRAFGWGDAVIQANHALVDRSQRPFYLLMIVQRWLVLVLDLTTAALALLLVGLAVRLRGEVDVGLTGVSLVQLISLSETVNMLIQFWTSIETSIGAVSRIKQFAEETGEESLPGETQEPPPRWPEQGAIQISNLSASYGDGKGDAIKALDAVNLEIKAGEKVGICGRTGRSVSSPQYFYRANISLAFSGKSSLFLALLRLLDSSSGSITIDGVPSASLQRETIRGRLITLTQDQFVLPGTIRHNVDPLDAYPDTDVKSALHLVGLFEAIEQLGGLDASFDEDALSHGQKQLFFLARAVLRKHDGKVILLDEATSRQVE
ncbi:P-loop containing nucleoside triphosphate hydrolase protein [Fusarium acuminatum]|uniref:P-loop containing nucleoside triphosphate hydrolase protein n=1 Tax=Fusarium acuminatum TaxID=5515 RepID=A0ABZ2WM16_9HYPO